MRLYFLLGYRGYLCLPDTRCNSVQSPQGSQSGNKGILLKCKSKSIQPMIYAHNVQNVFVRGLWVRQTLSPYYTVQERSPGLEPYAHPTCYSEQVNFTRNTRVTPCKCMEVRLWLQVTLTHFTLVSIPGIDITTHYNFKVSKERHPNFEP